MDTSNASTTLIEPSPFVEWLKIYLTEEELPVSGRKDELINKFADF